MPRRGNIAKRDVLADPIYNSKMVTRLVNSIMLDGKKGVAQKIVYDAFTMIQEKTGINTMIAEDPLTAVAIGTGRFIEFTHGGDNRDREY